MRHLIIPDIHERPAQVQKIIALLVAKGDDEPPPDRAIFLGDWWDTREEHKVNDTNNLLLDVLDGHDSDCILGNHDASYFFGTGKSGDRFLCSGFRAETLAAIGRDIPISARRKFKLASVIQIDKGARENAGRTILCSHAGVHPKIWEKCGGLAGLEQECMTALDLAFNGDFHRFFDVGGVRGGSAPFGGLTWLDWNHEFQPIPDLIQIVGHTYSDEQKVRVKPHKGWPNFCIDTGLEHFVIVDDLTGRIEIRAAKEEYRR